MNIYFCGSIRGGTTNVGDYKRLIQYLKQFGTVLTEHVGDENVQQKESASNKSDADIWSQDVEWLTQADVVVAECSTPSLGVGYEIGYANHMRKSIVALYRNGSPKPLSAMIRGCRRLTVIDYDTVDELAVDGSPLARFLHSTQSRMSHNADRRKQAAATLLESTAASSTSTLVSRSASHANVRPFREHRRPNRARTGNLRDDMPPEMILLIMSFLPVGSAYNLGRTCKEWLDCFNDDYLWQSFYYQRIPELERLSDENVVQTYGSFKNAYKNIIGVRFSAGAGPSSVATADDEPGVQKLTVVNGATVFSEVPIASDGWTSFSTLFTGRLRIGVCSKEYIGQDMETCAIKTPITMYTLTQAWSNDRPAVPAFRGGMKPVSLGFVVLASPEDNCYYLFQYRGSHLDSSFKVAHDGGPYYLFISSISSTVKVTVDSTYKPRRMPTAYTYRKQQEAAYALETEAHVPPKRERVYDRDREHDRERDRSSASHTSSSSTSRRDSSSTLRVEASSSGFHSSGRRGGKR